jgi:non-ribosomal peptide synthetase component F
LRELNRDAAVLPDISDYPQLAASFLWRIPARFNMGVAVSDVWAATDPDRPAILDVRGDALETLTFGALAERSNRLAHALALAGVARGDRVAILLPQMAEVVVAHVAIYNLGAVALPLASCSASDACSEARSAAGRAARRPSLPFATKRGGACCCPHCCCGGAGGRAGKRGLVLHSVGWVRDSV